MGNNEWLLRYKKSYLIELVNSRRFKREYYELFESDDLIRLLRKENKSTETELETVKRLINEVREGRVI